MKIVTFNLRCVWDGDDTNAFIHRMGLIWNRIRLEQPDIIGFQEVVPKQLEALEVMLPDYLIVGQGRNADCGGEGLYTALRKASLSLLGLDTFWIGPDPYKPESRFEDQSKYTRICVVTMIQDKASGQIFRLYNLHLDHLIENARLEGIDCVWKQLQANNEKRYLPSIILGDFNAEADDRSIHYCLETGALFDITSHIPYTYHDFGKGVGETPGSKIDYIFVTQEFLPHVKEVAPWEDSLHGIYLSDHYPVAAEITLY